MTQVRSFTDQELLDRVKSIGGKISNGDRYLIIGLQSTEDDPNAFDDKFYVFHHGKFVMVTTGTTNVGTLALQHFNKKGLPGAAVWKTDMFYEGLYEPGYHRGRMKALRQVKPIKYYRDKDKDVRAEEYGEELEGIIYANFHGVSYDFFSNKILSKIGAWSYGCQVCNRMSDYKQIISACWELDLPVDYALLKEW